MVTKRTTLIWILGGIVLLNCNTVQQKFMPTTTPIPPTPTITVTPSPEPDPFPIGLYVVVLGDGEVVWEIEFLANGQFSGLKNGKNKLVTLGKWENQGNTIQFSGGFSSCKDDGEGLYRWVLNEGQILSFEKIEESCSVRSEIFSEKFNIGSTDYNGYWKFEESSGIVQFADGKEITYVCGLAGEYVPILTFQLNGNKVVALGDESYLIRVGEQLGYFDIDGFYLLNPLDEIPEDCGENAIEIVQVEPPTLVADQLTTVRVTVRYRLGTNKQGEINLGFNTYVPYGSSLEDAVVVKGGEGEVVLVAEIEPVYWGSGIPFMVYVNLSEYPHSNRWVPLAFFMLPAEVVKNE